MSKLPKKLKLLFIIIFSTLGLVILFSLGVLAYMTTPQAHNTLKTWINQRIPGQLSWDIEDLSWLKGRLRIRNVSIKDASGTPLVDLDAVELHVDWPDLTRGRITATAVTLDRPRIHLRMMPDGELNIAAAFSSDTAKQATNKVPADAESSVNIAVTTLTLTDGEVLYEDPKTELSITAKGISLTVNNLDLAGLPKRMAGETALTIGHLQFSQAGSVIAAAPLTVSAKMTDGALNPIQVSIQGEGWRANLDGAVASVLNSPALSLDLQADADLARIREMLRLPEPVNGPVSLTGALSGEMGNPDLNLTIDYGAGQFMGYGVRSLHGELQLSDLQVSLPSLRLDADMGAAALTAEADLREAFPEGFLSSAFDLTKITYEATLDRLTSDLARLPIPAEGLSGAIDANARVSGRGVLPDQMTVDADVAVTGRDLAMETILSPVPLALQATARYDGSRVTASTLTVATNETRIQGDGTYDLSKNNVEAALALNSPDLSPLLTALGIPDISGGLEGTLDVQGPVSRPAAKFNIRTGDMVVSDIALGTADVTGDLSESGTLSVETFTLTHRNSVLRASGEMDLFREGFDVHPELPWDVTARLTAVKLDDFLTRFGAAGTVDGTLRLGGSLAAPQLTAALSGTDLSHGDLRIGDLTTDLRFEGGTLFVDTFALQYGNSRATASGTLHVAEKGLAFIEDPVADLMVAAATIRINDFLPEAGGTADFKAQVKGPLSDLSAAATLSGTDLSFGEQSLGALNAGLRYDKGKLTLDSVALTGAASRLTADGWVQILSPGTLTPVENPGFVLNIPDAVVELAELAPNLSGTLNLDCDISGTVSNPRGTVAVSGKKLDFAGQKLAAIDADLRLSGGRVNVASLSAAVAENQAVTVRGWLKPFEKTYDLSAKTDGIDLNNFVGVDVSPGRLRFDLAGTGHFDHPEVNGSITVAGLKVRDTDVAPIVLNIALAKDILNVRGDYPADITAEADLSRRKFTADMRFADADLAPYFTLAELPQLGGVLTGTITASGGFDDPGALAATADISRLEIDMADRNLVRSESFSIDYRNRRLSVPDLRLKLLEDGNLDIKGTADPAGRLDVAANGRIPLAVFREFDERLQSLAGTLTLDIKTGGTFQQPDIQGDVEIANGGMMVPDISQKLENLNAEIQIHTDKIVIQSIDAELGEGSLNLSGNVGLENWQPTAAALQLNARRLPLEVPDMAESVLNAQLSLNGTLEQSKMTGEVVIVEGRYYEELDLSLVALARKPRKRKTDPKSEPKPPWMAGMALDVALKSINPFLIDNNLALMALKPSLRIKGTAANPVVSGRTAVEPGGTITYQDTEFELRRGVIDFLNPYTVEPTFDILARTEIRKWTIDLSVTGTPKDLKFVLTSDPPETQGDLLSLLTVGKTSAELASGTGGSSTSVTQMLADVVADKLAGSVKDATGLDIVELKYTEGASEEDEGDVAVTVGKELSRRLTVKYGVEARDGTLVQKATTEYKILENLIMSAFQDTEGTIGGGLIFRLEFR